MFFRIGCFWVFVWGEKLGGLRLRIVEWFLVDFQWFWVVFEALNGLMFVFSGFSMVFEWPYDLQDCCPWPAFCPSFLMWRLFQNLPSCCRADAVWALRRQCLSLVFPLPSPVVDGVLSLFRLSPSLRGSFSSVPPCQRCPGVLPPWGFSECW